MANESRRLRRRPRRLGHNLAAASFYYIFLRQRKMKKKSGAAWGSIWREWQKVLYTSPIEAATDRLFSGAELRCIKPQKGSRGWMESNYSLFFSNG